MRFHRFGGKFRRTRCITKRVVRKHHGKGFRCGSYTMLCQAGTRSHLFRRGFLLTGIPCGVINNIGFCTHGRVGSLLDCLGAVSGTDSSLTIHEVLGMPGEKVKLADVNHIRSCTSVVGLDFCSTLHIIRRMPSVNETTKGVGSFMSFVRKLGDGTRTCAIHRALRRIVRLANCIGRLRTRGARRTRTEVRGVSRLVSGARSFRRTVRRTKRPTALSTFLRRVTLITSVSSISPSRSCILLVALRDTGKLRFPGMFVIKVRSNIFPKCTSV